MGKLKALYQEYGADCVTKTLRLRSIKSVYCSEVIREDIPAYIATTRFNSSLQIFEMFKDLNKETKEQFVCLHLDGKNRIVCLDRVSIGCLNETIVHPREVFKSAVLSSAASIIAIHNHPTGDPEPSNADIQITKRLQECGKLLGIPLIDHIIIGNGKYLSLFEGGYV